MNVGEDGVGGNSVPGNGRARGILNVGGRDIGGRDEVASKPPGLSRPMKMTEKGSPDSVASIFGFGGGGGGGGDEPHGDGDPTFDHKGRSMHWLNKALVSTDQSAHQYWQIAYEKRLESNKHDLQEAGDYITKLMRMGVQAIVGVTDRVDANNDLVVKRQHQSGSTSRVDNP